MSKELIISKTLGLPLEAVTQTFAIVARKRVGKTYTASVMAEEFIRNKVPIVVLDPTGAWWGLRSSADGRADGYPVIIIGGSHADVPLDEHAGKIIADLVVDHPGYYVIDFSGTESEAAQDRFATEFGQHFYRRKESAKFPMHLFVDEADCFMPQRPFPGQQRMLGAFDTIVRRGGIRGIGVTMITQRPAVLNKNALTQAETLIALQISGAQDVDALEHWVNRHGTKEQRSVFLNSLATLQRGECWVWSPSWLEMFERVTIRERITFNSSATPKVGEKVIIAPKLASVDIAALGERIKSAAENIKANDPSELKKTIASLRADLKKAEVRSQQSVVSSKEPEVREVPVLTDADRELIARVEAACGKKMEKFEEEMRKVQDSLSDMRRSFLPICEKARVAAAAHIGPTGHGNIYRLGHVTPVPGPSKPSQTGGAMLRAPANGEVSGGLKRMMIALAQRPGLNKRQLGVRAGMSSGSGTFGTYLSTMRKSRWIEGSESLQLTPEGLVALGNYQPLPEGQDLLIHWLTQLGEGGAGRMLRALAEHYPNAYTKEQLGEAANISSGSGTFGTYLSKLRTLELIEGSAAGMRAAKEFFE